MKRTIGLALVLVAALSLAVVAQARPAGGGSPGADRNHRSADVTFTKWVTHVPGDPSVTLAGASMVGVVGGDVGRGAFAGKVVKDNNTLEPKFWLAQALYGFNGSQHSFVAYNFITQNNTTSPITATIRGVVVQGWMTGALVTGEYTQWDNCPIPTLPVNVFGTVCFQGTLHLQLGLGR